MAIRVQSTAFDPGAEVNAMHANRHGSASGHSREKGHFIAIAHRLIELAQVFVAGAHQVLFAQHLGAVALSQQRAHVIDGREIPFNLHRVNAERFPVTGKKLHGEVHG